MDTDEKQVPETDQQTDQEARPAIQPPKPEEDPRFNLVEEIAAKLDEARSKELSPVGPEEETPAARPSQEKQQAPTKEPEEPYELKVEREVYEKKLSLINAHEDIPLETLDKISAASTMDELKKIEQELSKEPTQESKTEAAEREEYFEVVINGKRRRVTKDELIAHYQKTEAADEYLEKARAAKSEAERLKKELEELKKQLYVQQSAAQVPRAAPQAQPAEGKVPAPQIDEAKLADMAKRLAYGDEEEYKKVLKEWTEAVLQNIRPAIGAPGSTGHGLLTEEQARQIARIEAERQLAVKAIQARFFSEYSDLAQDQILFELVNKRAEEKIAAGRDPYDWDTYDEAAKEIKAWRYGEKTQAREREGKSASTTYDLPKKVQEAIEERRRKKLQLDVIEGAKSAQHAGSRREPMTEEEMRREALLETAKARLHTNIGTGY